MIRRIKADLRTLSAMTDHMPTPWAYRPLNYDDWGWIRDATGNLVATARDGRVYSDQFDEHRRAGTDPYEANAAFIVKAVNSHDKLVNALEKVEPFLSYGDNAEGRLKQIIKDALASIKEPA